MKLFSRNAFFMVLVLLLVFACFAPVTFAGTCPVSAAAAGGLPFTFGSYYYHYVDGIPDGAPANTIEGLFYYYDANTGSVAGEYPGTMGLPYAPWFINAYGVWYPSQAWMGTAHYAGVSGAAWTANSYTVVMVTYDVNTGTADNNVTFSVFGSYGSNTQTPTFNFDLITDALPSGFGGPNNCMVPMQAIPQVTISGFDTNNPVTVDLTWTNPGHWSYGPAGHPELMYGFRVYYYNVVLPASPPLTNAKGSWTAVTDAEGGLWQIGDALPHQVTINQPAEGNGYYFALVPVGAGNCGAKAYEDTGFEPGFVGRNSSNVLENNPVSVDLLSFTAKSFNVTANIKWVTGSEVDTAGFNILRATSPNGKKTKVNDALIPATGGPGFGATYKFNDAKVDASQTYYYWLEEVEQTGQKLYYGSVGVYISPRETMVAGN